MSWKVGAPSARARGKSEPLGKADSALPSKALRVHQLLAQEYGEHPWRPHRDPLSGLVATILSQHTSDVNSGRAFDNLKARFGSWEAVRDAPMADIAEAIRVGGLADIKAPRIKAGLEYLWERRGSLSLDFLAEMDVATAKAWLTAMPGVGPKTAACVLLFSLGKPALPVDTHVYRVSHRLGLINSNISANNAHQILEEMLPMEAIYGFHVNMVAHGRRVCKAPRPRCHMCVLQPECNYWQRSWSG